MLGLKLNNVSKRRPRWRVNTWHPWSENHYGDLKLKSSACRYIRVNCLPNTQNIHLIGCSWRRDMDIFASSKSDSYSAAAIALLYAISGYIGPHYIGPWLYYIPAATVGFILIWMCCTEDVLRNTYSYCCKVQWPTNILLCFSVFRHMSIPRKHSFCLATGPLFTKQQDVLPSNPVKSRSSEIGFYNVLWWSYRTDIGHTFRQRCPQYACQILERLEMSNPEFCNFETSRDLVVRRPNFQGWVRWSHDLFITLLNGRYRRQLFQGKREYVYIYIYIERERERGVMFEW